MTQIPKANVTPDDPEIDDEDGGDPEPRYMTRRELEQEVTELRKAVLEYDIEPPCSGHGVHGIVWAGEWEKPYRNLSSVACCDSVECVIKALAWCQIKSGVVHAGAFKPYAEHMKDEYPELEAAGVMIDRSNSSGEQERG